MSTKANILRASSAAGSAGELDLPTAATPSRPSLFVPGRNCYRVARAERVALLIDGEAYFAAVAAAMHRATRSILIVGWDFHSRTRLHLDGRIPGPELLGDFLDDLARRRRSLHVNVLIWDYPMLFAKGRELPPIYGLGWRPHRRVHVHYDDRYPTGASQHQKIVVVDDAIAFCGGLDLTQSRWDTREHRPGDGRRTNVGEERSYAPFHDVMMAVDGEAARALGQVARDRWRAATGKELPRPPLNADPWPPDLRPAVRQIDVAVSRTMAPALSQPPVREVEALYLDMIAAAKRYIYIENQYFTSDALGTALAARLSEPEGPEIVTVMRLHTSGWLESSTMGVLRTKLLKRLRDADRFGRFHPYYPHIPGLPDGQCCDLHSKLIVIDDEVLRLGSANFCNRSMSLDTECDVAIEARGDPDVSAAIGRFVDELVAEHLDVAVETVAEARRGKRSLSETIESLKSDGRTLRRFEQLDEVPELVASIASVADPEDPIGLEELIEEFAPETRVGPGRPLWQALLATALAIGGLAALWRYTPLSHWAEVGLVMQWARDFANLPWAPLIVLAAYTPASLVLFPRPLITLFAVIAFGAWPGFVYAFGGILLAALVTYWIGRPLDRSVVRRLAGERINKLTALMRRRGLLAVTAVRLVPIAPFAVVNIVAGAFRIRLRDFMGGSAIGILPGTLAATVLGEQVMAELHRPGSGRLEIIAAALLLAALAIWALRRRLLKSQWSAHGAGDAGKS